MICPILPPITKTVRLTLPGPPVTKKNSPRIAPILINRGGKQTKVFRIQPSKQYERWAKEMLTYAPLFHAQLAGKLPLPLANPFNLGIHVYLANAREGDLIGYQESVLDILQATVYREKEYQEFGLTLKKQVCVRRGLGIYFDDKQNVSTDGCRIMGVDRERPRIEVTLTFYGEPVRYDLTGSGSQGSLFDEEEDF